MAQVIVTGERVILSDDATKEELEAMRAEHPGKSIMRASSLALKAGITDDPKLASRVSELTTRVNKLERLVEQLLRGASTVNNSSNKTLAEKIAQRHNEEVKAQAQTTEEPTPEPETDNEETEERTSWEPTWPDETETAAAPATNSPKKAEKKAEPVTNSSSKSDKYDIMDKEELLRRVKLRGGNAKKIMAPFHARARTIALRNWLRTNPSKKVLEKRAAKQAAKAGRKAKPVPAKKAGRTESRTRH
jgi:hypothetical protein